MNSMYDPEYIDFLRSLQMNGGLFEEEDNEEEQSNNKYTTKPNGNVSNVRKEAKRHVATFDWIEEIKEPSFKNNSSDSDEEPEKYDIPIEIINKRPSEYKVKLIKHISRPFDKKEYKGLIKKATYRPKKILSKDTRKGARTFETNEFSKSYFDWYPDFARMVDKAGKGKCLLLLRWFFFWLENVGHEGAFGPWIEKGGKNSKTGPATCKYPNN